MSVDWYCKLGGQEQGPLSGDQLKQLARQGRLKPDSPVRRGADGNWVTAQRIRGLFEASASSSSISTRGAASSSSPERTAAKSQAVAAKAGRSTIKRAKPLPSSDSHIQPVDHVAPIAEPPLAGPDTIPPHDTLPISGVPAGPLSGLPAGPNSGVQGPPPSGVPVGMPVAPSASSPPQIASSPKPPPPRIAAGSSVPMGVAVSSPPGVESPPVSADSPSPMMESRSQRLMERRKSSNPLVIVAVAAIAVVLVGGVGLTFFLSSSNPETVAEATEGTQAAAPVRDPEWDPEDEDPEADPETDLESDGTGATASSVGFTSTAAKSSADPAAAGERREDPRSAEWLSVAKSTRRWADASRMRVRSGSSEIRIAAAWVEESAGSGELAGNGSSAAGPLVCFLVEVRNVSRDSVVDYSSWNGTGLLGASIAALIDAGDDVLPLVPVDQTDLENRQESVAISPGELVKDVLAFRQSHGENEEMKLLLPRAALGSTGHIAFKIPRVMLMSGSRPNSGGARRTNRGDGEQIGAGAGADGRPTAADPGTMGRGRSKQSPVGTGASDRGAAAIDKAASMPAGADPASEDGATNKNGGQPLTFDDLRRSIEGDDSGDEDMAGKGDGADDNGADDNGAENDGADGENS